MREHDEAAGYARGYHDGYKDGYIDGVRETAKKLIKSLAGGEDEPEERISTDDKKA